MFLICAGLCLVTSLMFGLLPAVRFSRPAPVSGLKDDVGGGSRRVGRVHRLAAAVQVGNAVPFLVSAGLLLDTMRAAATADLGFEPEGLIAAPIDVTGVADTEARAQVLVRSARDDLGRTRGILSVGLGSGLPLDFRSRAVRVSRLDASSPIRRRATRIDDGYLNATGIGLVRGRGITTEDRAGTEPVALLTAPVAARLFPDREALGERLTVTLEDETTTEVTIVGVTADLVGSRVGNPRDQILLPLAQHPTSSLLLVARGADPRGSTALAPAFRTALQPLLPRPV